MSSRPSGADASGEAADFWLYADLGESRSLPKAGPGRSGRAVAEEDAVPRKLIDEKFRKYPLAYLVQPVMAGLVIMVLMLFQHRLDSSALVAALGASAFTVFTIPHAKSAQSKVLVGGYICGVVAGVACRMLLAAEWLPQPGGDLVIMQIIIAGASVALAMLLMVVLDLEHPPAAAVALGLVVGPWQPWNVAYVMAAITALSLIRHCLTRVLKDLA